MARMILDYINMMIDIEQNRKEGKAITYEEWCEIRRNGSPEEIADAVERMEAAGGYANLVQEN